MLRDRNVRIGLTAVLGVVAAALLLSPVLPAAAQDSPCGESVVVATGDTLNAISRRCQVTVAALLAANPSITNRDLIYIGQTLVVPAPVPSGGAPAEPTSPTAMLEPAAGPAGTTVTLTAVGLPAGAEMVLGVGPVNAEFSVVGTATTDASGTLTTQVRIPDVAQNGSRWVVVVQAQDGSISTASNLFSVMPDGQGGGTGGPNQYVVRTGDTLFSLAQANGLTLAELLAANPQIANPDRIDIGDIIVLPVPGAPAPPTGGAGPQVNVSPASGLPGTLVQLSASGFAANSEVTIAVGPQGQGGTPAASATSRTDAAGILSTEILIPATAASGERWAVVVSEEGGAAAEATFLVNGAAPDDGPVAGQYVVQPGDTLFRIALNRGVSVEAMMAANPAITDPALIYVGQVLTLP